ncbi:MAG: hypothetical protein AAF725_16630 [Acidobacteriota bacterium]
MRHPSKLLFVSLLAALLAVPSAFADQWIHLQVEGDSDERVTINLPLSMVRAAAAMIPAEVRSDLDSEVEIAINDLNMEWSEMRDLWRSIQDAPEATFATVQTRDESFAVRKEGQFLLVKTTEVRPGGTEIDVRLPMNVVDALFSGPEGSLDFTAALDALASYGPGHLVSIRDGEDTVKVWIDDENEPY